MEVIPAINCHLKDSDCVREKVRRAEKFSSWIHLDVADGNFTYNKTWAEPGEWKEFATHLNLEVHLMVEEPEKIVGPWLEAGAKRIIIHFETVSEESAREIVKRAKEHSSAVMIALNPETHIADLSQYFRNFAEYQILAVHPGLSGQKFLPLTLKKIKDLRKIIHSARIEVDGGIDEEIAKIVKKEGADAVVSSSFIFGSEDPANSFERLLNA